MIGLSSSTIYNLEKAGTFPKRIHVTKHATRYKVGEIRDWMKSLEKAGRAKNDKVPEILSGDNDSG